MTAKEIQKRNAKAESLKVLLSEDGQFFVESEKGKILYNVILDDEETSCTCGDFAKNSKKDPDFRCKHMLSVMNAIPKREVENAIFCEKHVPKLDDRFMINIKQKDFADNPLFSNSKVVYSVYDSEFKKSLNPSFKKKLLIEGITKDDIKVINDASYLNLTKLAITNSDAVIMGSEKINSGLETFIEERGIPVLEFNGGDNYIDKYSDFYDELIS